MVTDKDEYMKKSLKIILIVIISVIALGIIINHKVIEDNTFYSFDSDPALLFDENLQLIGIDATCKKRSYNFVFFGYVVRNYIDNIFFSIQGENGPLEKSTKFNVTRVVVYNEIESINENRNIKKEFIKTWKFDYTGRKRPDFVSDDIEITGWSENPITKELTASISTHDDNLGSFYYKVMFDNELKNTDEFKIQIYYTSEHNEEEKVIEINAKKLAVKRDVTNAYDREIARY